MDILGIAASVQGLDLPQCHRHFRQPLRRQGLDLRHCHRHLPRRQILFPHETN